MMLPTSLVFFRPRISYYRVLQSYNPTNMVFPLVRSRKFVTFAIVKFIKT